MDEILTVHSMLHLIFHRNKNQHRRTKWWKWLSILKRATLDFARSGVKSHLATHKRGLPNDQANSFLSAFSTVVADNQFSALGVVLLAVLARLSKITGISHQKMEPATTKSRMTVAKEDLGERIRRIDNAPLAPVKISHADSKVSRVSKEKPTEKSAEYTESTEDGVSKTTSKKKKKKKKNAIDDLFSGLF
ncbi:Pc12g04700 [Penicillium rubens Wisconsin 54-1255]|uniref:Pc12g04700 protein n=1 Tax=Penicillium rubens (strain ATCC 28089 / DSM 1075 / NRRL 1951 / Wisconsin 54-1255) TaxID=500485 RepID=B6GY81_PENRW|nr:Pc12g04700 [Penicillium rubens Wisconsin 54-1255]